MVVVSLLRHSTTVVAQHENHEKVEVSRFVGISKPKIMGV